MLNPRPTGRDAFPRDGRDPREKRGVLTRPTVREVYAYRASVDQAMEQLLTTEEDLPARVREVIEIGLNHEEQHQELILMDIKHVLSCNPLHPAYGERGEERPQAPMSPLAWIEHPGGLCRIGHEGEGFSFDNERPAHTVFLSPFRLASRLVTAGAPSRWQFSGIRLARDVEASAPGVLFQLYLRIPPNTGDVTPATLG